MVWARSNNPSILRLAIGSKLASTKGSSGTHQRGGSEWVVRTRCDALKRYGELPTYCGYSLQQYPTYLTFCFFIIRTTFSSISMISANTRVQPDPAQMADAPHPTLNVC